MLGEWGGVARLVEVIGWVSEDGGCGIVGLAEVVAWSGWVGMVEVDD